MERGGQRTTYRGTCVNFSWHMTLLLCGATKSEGAVIAMKEGTRRIPANEESEVHEEEAHERGRGHSCPKEDHQGAI